MKEAMISYLKEHNKVADANEVITKLYYGNNNEYVEDFSYFANDLYMSKSLLGALEKGQTLTRDLKNELDLFVVEACLN